MWFEQLQQDVRYALRSFAKSPLFAITAVVSLAIGIAADTTVFTIANGLLLRAPAGVVDPDRLVDINGSEDDQPFGINQISFLDFADMRDRATTIAGLYGYEPFAEPMSLSGADGAERIFGHYVTTSYFDVLGVPAGAGRTFDTRAGAQGEAELTVVLSHAFWTRRFKQDPGVIGRTITLNNSPFTVMGVAAQGFTGTSLVATDLWVPLTTTPSPSSYLMRRGLGWALVRARLRPGVSVSQAAAEIDAIGRALGLAFPDTNTGKGLRLAAASFIPGNLALPLAGIVTLIMGFVSLVLVIACANLAGVLLARATSRRREIAVRVAVGAGRSRLIRQLLTETLLLFAAASIAGVMLARAATTLVMSVLPEFPMPVDISLALDTRTIAFAVGLSLVAAVLCGLAPALQASRPDVIATLKDEAMGVAAGSRLRNVFVIGQVAIGLIVLAGAGLFTRALQRASALEPGFDPVGIELASIDLSLARYEPAAGQQVQRVLTDRVREIPGVTGAALAASMPTGGSARYGQLALPGTSEIRGRPLPADWNVVTPGYFSTLRIPLIAGRDFTSADRDGSQRVIIVSEEAARRYWPGENPIGKTLVQHLFIFRIGQDNSPRILEVIGVVGGVRTGARETLRPQVYLPLSQHFVPRVTIAARTGGQRITGEIREAVTSVDRDLPILNAQTLPEAMRFALLPQRMSAAISSVLGLVGLLLAMMGIYGVTAFAVAQRTREIGIRLSLGATPSAVTRMVLRFGMTLVVIGSVAGIAIAAAANAAFASSLSGFPPVDVLALAAPALAFVIVGLAACYAPTRRAVRIDPASVLRYE